MQRLEVLGAQPDEIEAVRAAWAESPPDAEEIGWVRHATDAELAHELRRTRAEYVEHTTLDGDEAETGGAPAEGSSPSSDETPDEHAAAVKAALERGDHLEAQRLILAKLDAEQGEDAPSLQDRIDAALASGDEALAQQLVAHQQALTEGNPPTEGEPTESGEAEDATESEPPELPADIARVDDIINWVGGDAERAAVALEAERARSTQRSTLIETLEMIIRAAAD